MKDLNNQISFIVNSVDRILSQIDLDVLSPTFGCAHLDYWRDKTSVIADMRRQEVMLTLALLYRGNYPDSSWKGNNKLKIAIEALLSFWCKNQYKDGSMDEWYKGERGFAAAAFSTHAVARTIDLMQGIIHEKTAVFVKDRLQKTACWLSSHDDLFKTNHEAVAVAALAWTAQVLGNNVFKNNAYEKLKLIIRSQTKEGWFPEVGHMDIGYTFLTIEFALMAMELWQDWKYIEPFRRAFDFACEWLHPDLTIGKEYGVCQNTYISRIAIILMSGFSNHAQYLKQRITEETADFPRYSSTLADDLRLLRNSFQPFLAYDYAQESHIPTQAKENNVPLSDPQTITVKIYPESALVKFIYNTSSIGIFALAAGGLIRFFDTKTGNIITDYGYSIALDGIYATNYTYNRNTKMQKIDDREIVATCLISPVKKLMPSFLARCILHMACTTAIGSRLSRKIIDILRKKKGTAINQSCVNLHTKHSPWVLIRKASFQKDGVIIIDRLIFKIPIGKESLFFLESIGNQEAKLRSVSLSLADLPIKIKELEITKHYRLEEKWNPELISIKSKP